MPRRFGRQISPFCLAKDLEENGGVSIGTDLSASKQGDTKYYRHNKENQNMVMATRQHQQQHSNGNDDDLGSDVIFENEEEF